MVNSPSPCKEPEKSQIKDNTAKRVQAPPPIIVKEVNSCEKLYSIITRQAQIENFQVKFINDNTAKINATDAGSYRLITSNLQADKYNFHTYENKQDMPIRVMIKELHHTCDPKNINIDLKNKGFKVIDVSKKLSHKTKAPHNMFMATFEKSEDVNKIYSIKHIIGCRVNVEALKGSKLIPQCKKCQAFRHIAQDSSDVSNAQANIQQLYVPK